MSTGRQTPDLKHHPDAWLQSSQSEIANGGQKKVDDVEKKIWFKSQPLTREFCHRLTHLQLTTDSHDQGYANHRTAGSWSWFEVAILPSPDATEPRKAMDGEELVFHSHSNRLGCKTATRSHGVVFDRRSKLLANLEVRVPLSSLKQSLTHAARLEMSWLSVFVHVSKDGRTSRTMGLWKPESSKKASAPEAPYSECALTFLSLRLVRTSELDPEIGRKTQV